jgi:hypothetical protein
VSTGLIELLVGVGLERMGIDADAVRRSVVLAFGLCFGASEGSASADAENGRVKRNQRL